MREIIYGDIKPENILIDEKGHVNLTDHGFSRMGYDEQEYLNTTLEYTSPEVLKG